MIGEPRPPRNPWFPAFILAVATFAGSVAALAFVTFAAVDDGGAGESLFATSETPTTGGPGLRLWLRDVPGFRVPESIPLPPAANEREADVVVAAGDRGEPFVASRYVPVTGLHAGIDGLTSVQLKALLTGATTAWPAVGGLPGRVVPAFVTADTGSIAALLGVDGFPGARQYPNYDELLAAMTPGSGIVALVPLPLVTPAVRAVSLDGIDLVRGTGDPSTWPLTHRLRVYGQSKKGQAAIPSLARALDEPLPSPTIVVATGDILQSRCTLARIEASGDWAAPLRGPMGDYLAAADLALGSLDGSIQDIAAPFGCVSTTNLSSPPQVIEALTLAGFDGLTIATNHIFDCGQQDCGDRALVRTIELLQASGIKTVGGGPNLEAALRPAIFDVNGVTFGVLGFDDVAADELEATADRPGTAPLDDSYAEERAAGEPAFFRPASELTLDRFTARIRALAQQTDVVIVQVQTGTEDTHTPSDRSIKALRAAAEAGAGLVIGNQAHWPQAVEVRDGAFIAYALGNFIFDQRRTPEQTQGYLVEATFWGKRLANVRLLPYEIIDLHRPTFVEGQLRLEILGDVFAASDELPRGR